MQNLAGILNLFTLPNCNIWRKIRLCPIFLRFFKVIEMSGKFGFVYAFHNLCNYVVCMNTIVWFTLCYAILVHQSKGQSQSPQIYPINRWIDHSPLISCSWTNHKQASGTGRPFLPFPATLPPRLLLAYSVQCLWDYVFAHESSTITRLSTHTSSIIPGFAHHHYCEGEPPYKTNISRFIPIDPRWLALLVQHWNYFGHLQE